MLKNIFKNWYLRKLEPSFYVFGSKIFELARLVTMSISKQRIREILKTAINFKHNLCYSAVHER